MKLGKLNLKKIVIAAIMFIVTWVGIEMAAVAVYAIVNHSLFSKNEFKQRIRSSIQTESDLSTAQGSSDLLWINENTVEVIHPYFGFAPDPNRNGQVSDFGFFSGKDSNPILKRSPDKIIIGLFGGSFAMGTYWAGQKLIKEYFQSADKEVVVLNFSSGGYKQPQQLLILGYLLSLGAEFDIVINLDGFNEVVLPFAENVPAHVYPFYPRQWDTRTKTMLDTNQIKSLGQMEVLKEQRASWARLFNKFRLYYSPAFCLVWQYRDSLFDRSIYAVRQTLERHKNALTGNAKSAELYVSQGPQYSYSGKEQLFGDLAMLWRRTSLQMKLLCDANHIRYYHFLQPNQYVEGSKPMSDAEKKMAINNSDLEYSYSQGAIKGYPHLKKAGEELARDGVNFTDLTMIFAQNNERLYADTCCHLNQQGYQLVTKRILEVISAQAK
ncbi:MAG: hypothetical protein ABI977_21445 [Acidobacteriota bacterium]